MVNGKDQNMIDSLIVKEAIAALAMKVVFAQNSEEEQAYRKQLSEICTMSKNLLDLCGKALSP